MTEETPSAPDGQTLPELPRGEAACTPVCWTATRCPRCGNDLPPRGRSVPMEWGIPSCCDRARMDPSVNPRHLWSEDDDTRVRP